MRGEGRGGEGREGEGRKLRGREGRGRKGTGREGAWSAPKLKLAPPRTIFMFLRHLVAWPCDLSIKIVRKSS